MENIMEKTFGEIKMNSNQLNAFLTERPNVKLASPLICSDKVKGKSGSIVGYPPFINNMLGAVNNYSHFHGEVKA